MATATAPDLTVPNFQDEHWRGALESYYGLEQAGALDQWPKDGPLANFPVFVDQGRKYGQLPGVGLDNLRAWQAGNPIEPTRELPDNPTNSTTFTPTTSGLPPGTPLRSTHDVGRNIGQTVGAGVGALAPFPLSLATSPAAADIGGRIGGGVQAAYERATGAAPSSVGGEADPYSVQGRAAVSGLSPLEAVLTSAVNLIPGAANVGDWIGNRILANSPTGRRTAAEAAATAANQLQNVGQGLSQAGALQTASENAPVVRGAAGRAIDESTAAAQAQAQTAEDALSRRTVLRSNRLQGPPPEKPAPKVSPIVDEYGQPIITQPRTPPSTKLRTSDVTPDEMAPRRVMESLGANAERTATLLKSTRDAVGDVQTVRTLMQHPDGLRLLYSVATPDERTALDQLVQASNVLRTPPMTPVDPAAAGLAASAPSGITRNLFRGASLLTGGMLGGHAAGGPGGGLGAFAAYQLERAAEPVVRNLLDRIVNSGFTRAVGSATTSTMRLAPFAAAPAIPLARSRR